MVWNESRSLSFRDAPLGAGPESITTTGSMDSGLALRAPRNDNKRLFRRRRPRPLRAAQALERLRHSEHTEIVEAAADNLHADRKTAGAKAAVDRGRRIFRHVPRHGVSDVLERPFGIVDRRRQP